MGDKKDKDLQNIWKTLPDDVKEGLLEACKVADSPEDLYGMLMVGDCPVCGSDKTRDTNETPLDDPAVGICMDCHTMWCLDCGTVLESWPCLHWQICETCEHARKEDLRDGEMMRHCEYSYNEMNCPILKNRMSQ